MNTTTSTHIAQRKEQALSQQQQVQRLLFWSEEQYAWFQYETGLAYLKFYIRFEYGRKQLEERKTFWNWWKNHWNNRDAQFLGLQFLQELSVAERIDIYTDMHDARTLAAEIYPNGVVLGDSYKQMIQQLIDETHA